MGKHIEKQAYEILDFFGIKNAILQIEDKGALAFVIAARVEAAIKKIILPILLEMQVKLKYQEFYMNKWI